MKNPIEVFSSLKRPAESRIDDLWDLEKEVLEKYSAGLQIGSRVAIELPTGAGKSVIGLLILESWRLEGKRVAILTASNALAEDMTKRCHELGVESALITGRRYGEADEISRVQNKRRYSRKLAIGVMNYWAYMMAKDIPEPDVLVVDDADFFENFLLSYYGVTVSRTEDPDLWAQLMNDLAKHRIYQARVEAFMFSDTTEETLAVYFTHSLEIVKKLRTLVLSGTPVSEELSFSFDRNKNLLETCLMFVTREEIVFAPYVTPGLMHDRLRVVEKIIFMSATIGSKEYIHRTLGSPVELELLTEREVKSHVGTMGKRIIFPLDGITQSAHMDDDLLRAITTIAAKFPKLLVICNSYREAYRTAKVLESIGCAATIYKKESDSRNFADAKSGALVTAGRFIGIDLPDEACRVEVVTKMPYVLGPADAFARNVLEDDSYVNEKVGHRLVQAFGRCNRNKDDYAVYFMLDSRLASDNQADAEICGYFPTKMRAELDYGQDYAETGGVLRCMEIADAMLEDRLADFGSKVAASERELRSIAIPDTGRPYLPEIQAWHELTVRQNYLEAAQRFVECGKLYLKARVGTESAKRQAAWSNYMAGMCFYLAYLNYGASDYKEKAVKSLSSAVKEGGSSWFSGLQLVVDELSEAKTAEEVVFNTEVQDFKERLLRTWKEFAASNTTKRRNPRVVWGEIVSALSTGKHGEICDKLKVVFEQMGFEVRRRDDEEGMPDLELFANVGSHYVCIVEVKTKEQTKPDQDGKHVVSREDVDQLSGHRPSYQTQYSGRPIFTMIFTNREEISETAAAKAANSVRILKGTEFASFLNRFFELMERGWTASNPYEVLKVMQLALMPSDYESILKPAEVPLVSIEDINKIVKW